MTTGMPRRAFDALPPEKQEEIRARRQAERDALKEQNPVALQIQAEAREMRDSNPELTHTKALNAAAQRYGFKNWQHFRMRIPHPRKDAGV